MIYNTRNLEEEIIPDNAGNRSNDTTESQKEKMPVLMLIFNTFGQISRD